MTQAPIEQVLLMAHGWGYNHHFFDALLNTLPTELRHRTLTVCLEAGYFPEQADAGLMTHTHSGQWKHHPAQALQPLLLAHAKLPWLGLGHSMGLPRLLELPVHWHRLICLHGFTHFVQSEQHPEGTPARVLARMVQKAEKNMQEVLHTFHQRCGHTMHGGPLNKKALLTDLHNMQVLNCASALQTTLMKGTLLHVVTGSNDKIVPPPLSRTCFENLLCEQGQTLRTTATEHASFANQPTLYTEFLLPLLNYCV